MPRGERRLGKGLVDLLGENAGDSASMEIPIKAVRPNPYQPRAEFDPDRLAELAASIRENGLLQPIAVRTAGDKFEIVVGERRFRAVESLGWTAVPAMLQEATDEQMLVLAMVENLQRANLSPVDEAQGYRELIDGFGLTQEEVAQHVGRKRPTIANALRLLALPAPVLALLTGGKLSAGHGRALLMLPDDRSRKQMALEAVKHGWSVRQLESHAASASRKGPRKKPGRKRQQERDPLVRRAELVLERGFGTKVRVRRSADGGGEVVVRFHDSADFLRLVGLMGGPGLAAELSE